MFSQTTRFVQLKAKKQLLIDLYCFPDEHDTYHYIECTAISSIIKIIMYRITEGLHEIAKVDRIISLIQHFITLSHSLAYFFQIFETCNFFQKSLMVS